MFHKVTIGDKTISPIDWEMNPDISFGTFESWGGRERVRNNNECVYYFFVDNWGDEPKLCLMERAVKHAKIMAEIAAPQEIIKQCVKDQGSSSIFEKSYAINEQIKQWLIDNVLDNGNSQLIMPVVEEVHEEDMGFPLPASGEKTFAGEVVLLPSEQAIINDDQTINFISRFVLYGCPPNLGLRAYLALICHRRQHLFRDAASRLRQ